MSGEGKWELIYDWSLHLLNRTFLLPFENLFMGRIVFLRFLTRHNFFVPLQGYRIKVEQRRYEGGERRNIV